MDPEGIDLEDWRRRWKTSGARELRGLLMKYRDPIGVNGIPEASDEYDSYLVSMDGVGLALGVRRFAG
jgi:hypothetical protein